jgi:hypothetical protein
MRRSQSSQHQKVEQARATRGPCNRKAWRVVRQAG